MYTDPPYYVCRQVKKFLLSQLLRLYHWKVYTLARANIPSPRTLLSLDMDGPDETRGKDTSGPVVKLRYDDGLS